MLGIFLEKQFRSVGVDFAQGLPRASFQKGVVLRLDPLKAAVVRSDKADEMAAERRVGIVALRVGLKPHAADAAFVLELPYPLRSLPLDFARHGHVPRALARRLLADLLARDAEDLREPVCDQILVLSVRGDLNGAEIDVVHRRADRQWKAVPVADLSAHGRAARLAQLLGDRKGLVFFMLLDLKLVQPSQQQDKRDDAAHCHQEQRAAQHADARRVFPVVVRHRTLP